MNLLLVEDDKTIATGLDYSLTQEGYTVTVCHTLSSAQQALVTGAVGSKAFDLLLLDLSLPDGSGYELCRQAKTESDVPVIFLTACDDEVNVVMGLDMGADDYITKPFRLRELMSRIHSVLRRYSKTAASSMKTTLQLGPIRIQLLEAKVYKHEQEILLTPLEYRLLLTFANHTGQVLTRSQLLEGIWDLAGDFVNDNTLTVYIKRLREKLEDDPANPALIHTVRGLGYRVGEAHRAES
ncbi:response regulator transcription factor [Gorillibacterium timonense]|uniref:response regulator transcription factor n=1 Tax=Gorillibacterium timonense TaxID=1689269 RepID=UPI00071E6721|nr:response regulator transcription factor [Gorillibacterium timonense]